MKLKSIIKNSLFAKSLSLAKSNPGKTGLIVLFDVSFLISFYYMLPFLAGYFASNIAVSETASFFIIFSIFSLLYSFLILFVYSFFKYCALDSIKSMFEKASFSFRRLGQFYLLNIALILPAFFLFSALIGGIKAPYRPYALIALGIPIYLFLYVIVNISHSLFYHGLDVKNSIKCSLNFTFAKIKVYRETILAMILGALILWFLFLGSGYLIRVIVSKNYALYLSAYSYFKQASVIVFDIALYFIILINRISFYSIIYNKGREAGQ